MLRMRFFIYSNVAWTASSDLHVGNKMVSVCPKVYQYSPRFCGLLWSSSNRQSDLWLYTECFGKSLESAILEKKCCNAWERLAELHQLQWPPLEKRPIFKPSQDTSNFFFFFFPNIFSVLLLVQKCSLILPC